MPVEKLLQFFKVVFFFLRVVTAKVIFTKMSNNFSVIEKFSVFQMKKPDVNVCFLTKIQPNKSRHLLILMEISAHKAATPAKVQYSRKMKVI